MKPKRRERRIVERNPSRSWNSAIEPIKPSGMMPAARAAITAICFGIDSASGTGAMPAEVAKSSAPRLSAQSRRWARAISARRKKAPAVSTIAINRVVPGATPRSASTSSTISAMSRTCSALSVFGSASASTRGPTAASISRTARRNGRLVRTTTSAPPRDTISAASGKRVRALSFSEAATLSSRSRIIASAPRRAAPSRKRRRVTGTNSSDRHTGSAALVITSPRRGRRRPRARARRSPCG